MLLYKNVLEFRLESVDNNIFRIFDFDISTFSGLWRLKEASEDKMLLDKKVLEFPLESLETISFSFGDNFNFFLHRTDILDKYNDQVGT